MLKSFIKEFIVCSHISFVSNIRIWFVLNNQICHTTFYLNDNTWVSTHMFRIGQVSDSYNITGNPSFNKFLLLNPCFLNMILHIIKKSWNSVNTFLMYVNKFSLQVKLSCIVIFSLKCWGHS